MQKVFVKPYKGELTPELLAKDAAYYYVEKKDNCAAGLPVEKEMDLHRHLPPRLKDFEQNLQDLQIWWNSGLCLQQASAPLMQAKMIMTEREVMKFGILPVLASVNPFYGALRGRQLEILRNDNGKIEALFRQTQAEAWPVAVPLAVMMMIGEKPPFNRSRFLARTRYGIDIYDDWGGKGEVIGRYRGISNAYERIFGHRYPDWKQDRYKEGQTKEPEEIEAFYKNREILANGAPQAPVPPMVTLQGDDMIQAAMKNREFNKVINLVKAQAENGDGAAQTLMGDAYSRMSDARDSVWYNSPLRKLRKKFRYLDYNTAFNWYKRAADQGHAEAIFKLGEYHRQGRGTSKDREEGNKLVQKAADLGYAMAQHDVGYHLVNAHGKGAHDYEGGMKWYMLAAEQGLDRGLSGVAELYEKGWGRPKDKVKAKCWYRLSETMHGKGIEDSKDLTDAENKTMRACVKEFFSTHPALVEKARKTAEIRKPKEDAAAICTFHDSCNNYCDAMAARLPCAVAYDKPECSSKGQCRCHSVCEKPGGYIGGLLWTLKSSL